MSDTKVTTISIPSKVQALTERLKDLERIAVEAQARLEEAEKLAANSSDQTGTGLVAEAQAEMNLALANVKSASDDLQRERFGVLQDIIAGGRRAAEEQQALAKVDSQMQARMAELEKTKALIAQIDGPAEQLSQLKSAVAGMEEAITRVIDLVAARLTSNAVDPAQTQTKSSIT